MPTIFISAVSDEFSAYRDQLRHDLTRDNVEVKIQEDFKDFGVVTLEKLDRYISRCDAVVHLVGDMTGAEAKPASTKEFFDNHPDIANRFPPLLDLMQQSIATSYTQWEAWLALYHRKVLLIAKADESAAERGPNYLPTNASRAAQEAHLKRLRAVGRYPGFTFTSLDNLAKQIAYTTILDLLAKEHRPSRVSPAHEIHRDTNRRYLRGYGLDPGSRIRVQAGDANEILYSVRLETLEPGPCGTYVEVIDHDPASACFYEPVDLDAPMLFGNDGLPPSEANP
jgi:uncharacterized protein DUF4062